MKKEVLEAATVCQHKEEISTEEAKRSKFGNGDIIEGSILLLQSL